MADRETGLMENDKRKKIPPQPIRVVGLVQAENVTGPMKPLLMFARNIQLPHYGRGRISYSVVTTIRASADGPPIRNSFLQAAEAAGIMVDAVRERFPFDPTIVPKLARSLEVTDPQIVESHDFKSHFLVWLLKKAGRVPASRWIAFHHGYTRMSNRVRMYQQLDRLSLRDADQVVTVCIPFLEQLRARGVQRSKITILANAIESRHRVAQQETLNLKHRLGLKSTDRVILSVGRLSEEKGHANLIDAYRLVRKRLGLSDLRLVLVGDGGEADKLRAVSEDLGDRVLFTGHVADPWPYYCMADVFALPSYSEGSPLALFEAMAAGLPIVASNVGGIPETLGDATAALLVTAGAVDDLACALERILRDADLANLLSRGARAAALKFSPEEYTETRLRIYESVLSLGEPPVRCR
jgi:L-malate glycosyltransferase